MQVFLAVQLYCAFESSRPCLAPGHSGFHTMVVSLLSELISTPMAVRRDKFGCDAQECARVSVDYPL